ncbi:palmitoyltransferase ZDHHC22-like [Ptychodera flava]|uniref:palmitoyltransferase ZDHHC22-like n=1 Tax=Ptychodera flava TaxID=63121 RepID=UPI00396A8886
MEPMRGFGMKVSNELWKMTRSRKLLLYANYMAITYYWSVYLAVVYLVLFVSIPTVHESYQNIQSVVFLFFMVSIKVNYFLSIWKDSVYKGTSTPTLVPKNWHHCITCQHHIPPKAHHCPLCNCCILKREEHCFFIGRCIGYRNQRFYIVYCFYVACGSIFGIVYAVLYINHTYGTMYGGSKIIYFLPFTFFSWLFGSMPTPVFGIIFLMYLSLMTFTLGGGLFAFNMLLVLGGQTRYEFNFNTIMRLPWYMATANLHETFGKFWLLSFLIPGITSPEGDGINVISHKEYKNI